MSIGEIIVAGSALALGSIVLAILLALIYESAKDFKDSFRK